MKDTERKLATILATDCVSFSKYMEDSEEKTLRNLNECRKIIDNKITEYGGKIFSTAGDSVVAEFASPVQCVKAAIEFQNEIYKRNDHSITELKLDWRVGIHVDDVIVENDNIMGSGVNISARLESECEPGGILLSTIVKDQVNKRIDAKIEIDGTRKLKNISDEFEVFKIKGLLVDDDDFFTEEKIEENSENQKKNRS
jgi:class 3 adenylate cyclase